ncbi:MAG TPA: hypothetical protein VFX28_23310, partial [Methylomirabilota bacterium]|nr:hypothetical protein [Methylomirabilota bacterium]
AVEEAGSVVGECPPGAIPPFGALFGVRTDLDGRLLEVGEVTVPGGDFQTLLRLPSAELRRLAEPRVGDFAVPEAVVEAGGAWRAGRRRRRAG